MIETVNGFGAQTIFFVHNDLFNSSDKDDDLTKPSSGNRNDGGDESDRTITKPLTPMHENNGSASSERMVDNAGQEVLEHWGTEIARNGPARFGLDQSFEAALVDLGLTSDPSSVGCDGKQMGDDLVAISLKKQ